MLRLVHPFPAVQRGALRSCGGNQAWSEKKNMQRCGCGVIASVDLLVYLTRWHGIDAPPELRALAAQDPIALADYDRFALALSRRYLPLIHGHGINGVSLALGLDLYFLRHRLPYRARWGVLPGHFWSALEKMLRADLPVILSVGPNFPLLWKKNMLCFYARLPDGSYRPAAHTLAHYVSVTGLDERWLQISSWGREYYVNREEYGAYIAAHSSAIVSNILWVERK